MSMTIDNDHVCALVRAAMARTGQDSDHLIETALRQYLSAVEGVRRAQVSQDIVTRCDEVLEPINSVLTTADFDAAIAADADVNLRESSVALA